MSDHLMARVRNGAVCSICARLLTVCLLSSISFAVAALQSEVPKEEEEKEPTELETVVVRGVRWSGGVWFNLSPSFGFFNLGGVGGGISKPGDEVDPNAEDEETCDSGTPASDTTSQPVDIATGTKLLYDLDFSAGSRDQPLLVLRSYRSTRTGSGLFGGKWSSTLEYTLSFEYVGQTCPGQLSGPLSCSASGDPAAVLVRYGAGAGRRFISAGSNTWIHAEDEAVLTRSGTTWTVTDADGSTQTYNAHGQIVSVLDARGVGKHYTYNANQRLTTVTHSSGKSLGLSWSGNRVSAITAPNGKTWSYAYNSGEYLTSVTLPDNLGTRTYHYEAASLPGRLTGVSVNGARRSRFSYYADGRVQWSGLGYNGDFDRSSFTYGTNVVNVTNALGQTTTYTTSEINGQPQITHVQRPASAACPAGWKQTTSYNADGTIAYVLDGLGVKTQYSYDDHKQVTQKNQRHRKEWRDRPTADHPIPVGY